MLLPGSSRFGVSGQGRVLGVSLAEDRVFLAELEPLESVGHFRLRQAREEKIHTAGALWEAPEILAENLMRLCMTYGLNYENVQVCLPRPLFFSYEREFPAMERQEMLEAVRWDIETNVPFGEGDYWQGFGSHGDRMVLAAVPSEYGSRLVDALSEGGLGVRGLTMEPTKFTHRREGNRILWRDEIVEISPAASMTVPWDSGVTGALYAALRGFHPALGIEFLPEEENPERARSWKMAGNLLLCGVILAAVILLAFNLAERSSVESELEELRREYAAETRDRNTMEGLSAGVSELASSEGYLCRLTQERRSWYALFSVLGFASDDGVCLTEIDVKENGDVLCGGLATSHARLIAYMEQLENGSKVFREKPVLTESSSDERGELRFRIRLRF